MATPTPALRNCCSTSRTFCASGASSSGARTTRCLLRQLGQLPAAAHGVHHARESGGARHVPVVGNDSEQPCPSRPRFPHVWQFIADCQRVGDRPEHRGTTTANKGPRCQTLRADRLARSLHLVAARAGRLLHQRMAGPLTRRRRSRQRRHVCIGLCRQPASGGSGVEQIRDQLPSPWQPVVPAATDAPPCPSREKLLASGLVGIRADAGQTRALPISLPAHLKSM